MTRLGFAPSGSIVDESERRAGATDLHALKKLMWPLHGKRFLFGEAGRPSKLDRPVVTTQKFLLGLDAHTIAMRATKIDTSS